MKYTLSSLLSIFTFVLFGQHTDLKEFGYRGGVKEVRTKTFVQFDPKTGNLTENVNLFSTVIFSVNKQGNFQEIKTIPGSDSLRFTKNVYTFKDDKKVAMKSYDNQGKELKADTAIFRWINDKTYIVVYQYNNRIVEITTMLNDEYRDYMGITHVYELTNGVKKLVKIEKSENYFDKDGHISKIVVTDMQTLVQSSRYVQEKVLDKKGNLIQYKVLDEASKLLQYVEREFVY
jgi:hypothetical protein